MGTDIRQHGDVKMIVWKRVAQIEPSVWGLMDVNRVMSWDLYMSSRNILYLVGDDIVIFSQTQERDGEKERERENERNVPYHYFLQCQWNIREPFQHLRNYISLLSQLRQVLKQNGIKD